METQVIKGHRRSNEGAAVEERPEDSINIALSAPKYSIFDEDKGVNIYPADAPKWRTFESEIAGLRIQIRSILPEKLPQGGHIPGREFYIQFKSRRHRTNKVEEIVVIENSSGYGVTIWDVDALVGVAKTARIKAVIKAAKDDPDILEALKVNFGMQDFVDAAEGPPEGPPSNAPPESMGTPEETTYQGGAYKPQTKKE